MESSTASPNVQNFPRPLPASRAARQCHGYTSLYQRLRLQNWERARGYCRELLWLEADAFLDDLLETLQKPGYIAAPTSDRSHLVPV